MVAQIEGFVTRQQAGLKPPASISRNITPGNGGAVLHWGGTRQNTGSHARCIAIWLAWQRYHMGNRWAPNNPGHGWADIAYNGGYCNHGFAFAGRGLGIRSAANGTNDGNQNYHAFVWIGGQGDTAPNQLAINALEWWIDQGRRAGGAGRRVRPHTDFTGSACPGPQLTPHARRLDNSNIVLPGPVKPEEPKEPFTVGQFEDITARLSRIERQLERDRVGVGRDVRVTKEEIGRTAPRILDLHRKEFPEKYKS